MVTGLIEKAFSAAWSAIDKQISNWIISLYEIIDEYFYRENPIGTLQEAATIINAYMNFYLIPTMVISVIVYLFRAFEVFATIVSGGTFDLVVAGIIMGIIGMGALAIGLSVANPSWDNTIEFMGTLGDSFQASAGLVTFFGALIATLLSHTLYAPAIAGAIFSIALVSASFVIPLGWEGWKIYALDIFAVIMLELSIWDYLYGPDDATLRWIAKITDLVTKFILLGAIIYVPLQLIAHSAYYW
jgi:hypothetical protein